MATFFSGQWIGTWSGYPMTGTLTGDVSRSGNTVTLSNLNCTWTATYGYGSDKDAWFAIYDGWDSWNRIGDAATGLSMNAGSGSKWIGDRSVTVGTTDTSHSFTFRSKDGAGISFTVTFSSGSTPPSDPSTSNVTTQTTSLSGKFSVSTWGSSGSGRFEYYFGTTSSTTDNYTLNPTSGYTSSTSVNFTRTGLTSNQNYYVRCRTWNNELNNPNGFILSGPYLTKAAASTNHSVDNITMLSARIKWSIPADGGKAQKKYYYSLDNGSTWVLASTYSGGSAGNGNYTISGLKPGTSYTVKFKVSTSAGETACPNFSFRTVGGVYGSVNNKTKQIKKMYGSVDGKTKKIRKFYGSANGKTKLLYRE